MAALVGFIMRRPTSGERFYLLNPTDISTPDDERHRTRRIKGYSPELQKVATVFCEARPYDRWN